MSPSLWPSSPLHRERVAIPWLSHSHDLSHPFPCFSSQVLVWFAASFCMYSIIRFTITATLRFSRALSIFLPCSFHSLPLFLLPNTHTHTHCFLAPSTTLDQMRSPCLGWDCAASWIFHSLVSYCRHPSKLDFLVTDISPVILSCSYP